MTEITTREEWNAALGEKTVLAACMQKGCLPCASVSPLCNMLSGFGGFLTARLDVAENGWFTDKYGVDGSPTWIVFREGEEIGRIDPAGKSAEELAAFFDGALGLTLSPMDLRGALEEGRRQADYLENCLAELNFRRKETSEDLLLASVRIKVFKACLECREEELARCVSAEIGRILERLRAQMRTPEDMTEARRSAVEKLPAMAQDYIRGLTEIRKRAAERER